MQTNKKFAASVRSGTSAAGTKTNYKTSVPQKEGIPIYDNNHVIGYLRGTVLHRKCQGSKHFLKNPPAISFGIAPLRQAIRAGAKSVWIQDTESNLDYTTDIWNFNQHAISINRGFGEQQALPLEFWTITDPKHPERQLSLLQVQP